MNVALGFKPHSGWAALIALGARGKARVLVDRRRIELVDEDWAKQPYHAAEGLEPEAARRLVTSGVESTRRVAVRELGGELQRLRADGHEVVGCGFLVGDPLPGWSVDEILAVHFRMHKAEGVLFRDVLVRAAQACSVPCLEIHEQHLSEHAALAAEIAALKQTVGAPWGKDQKEAAVAAALVLRRG